MPSSNQHGVLRRGGYQDTDTQRDNSVRTQEGDPVYKPRRERSSDALILIVWALALFKNKVPFSIKSLVCGT